MVSIWIKMNPIQSTAACNLCHCHITICSIVKSDLTNLGTLLIILAQRRWRKCTFWFAFASLIISYMICPMFSPSWASSTRQKASRRFAISSTMTPVCCHSKKGGKLGVTPNVWCKWDTTKGALDFLDKSVVSIKILLKNTVSECCSMREIWVLNAFPAI